MPQLPQSRENVILSLWSKVANSILFFIILTFFILGVAIYFSLGSTARNSLVEQMLHREQVIARSGALSIKSFIQLYGDSLIQVAKDDRVIGFSPSADERLRQFVETWKSASVLGLILVNNEGLVVRNENVTGRADTGATLTDRDYFVWAKTAKAGEVFVSEPIISRVGASKDQSIVVVATPLVRDGEFMGVLAASVSLASLTEDYVRPLLISERTRIYLINKSGILIASNLENLIGVDYFKYLEENPFLGSGVVSQELKTRLASGTEGKIRVALPNETAGRAITPFLIAYSPVLYNSSAQDYWLLAVATPEEDALIFMAPFYNNQLIGLVFAFLAVLLLAIRLSKIIAYQEALKNTKE